MERSDESEAGPEEISFAKVTKAFSKLSEIAEDKAILYFFVLKHKKNCTNMIPFLSLRKIRHFSPVSHGTSHPENETTNIFLWLNAK